MSISIPKAIIIVELYLDSKNRDDYSIQVEVEDVKKAIEKELAFTYTDETFKVYSEIIQK